MPSIMAIEHTHNTHTYTQIALQFYVSESNPFTFASEALDFAEVITLLASESIGVDTVNAAVLGISAQENGLS